MLINSEKSYTSTFICCFLSSKEACQKEKHKIRYKEEKPRRFVSGKTSFRVFCLLSV